MSLRDDFACASFFCCRVLNRCTASLACLLILVAAPLKQWNLRTGAEPDRTRCLNENVKEMVYVLHTFIFVAFKGTIYG